MTTKFNLGEYVLVMARVQEIAIGATESEIRGDDITPTVRYHLDVDAYDGGGYRFWLDEGNIVGAV